MTTPASAEDRTIPPSFDCRPAGQGDVNFRLTVPEEFDVTLKLEHGNAVMLAISLLSSAGITSASLSDGRLDVQRTPPAPGPSGPA